MLIVHGRQLRVLLLLTQSSHFLPQGKSDLNSIGQCRQATRSSSSRAPPRFSEPPSSPSFAVRNCVHKARTRAQGPPAMHRLGKPLLMAPLRHSGSVSPNAGVDATCSLRAAFFPRSVRPLREEVDLFISYSAFDG